MIQPRQHNSFTRLLNFARKENLIQNRIHLVKIKHQIQLTHIPKKGVEHFHKEVDSLQVCELVVVCVDAGAEEQTCVPTVHDFGGLPEFDEVGLVFLVPGGYEAVDLGGMLGRERRGGKAGEYLALEFDFLFILFVA
jgi:hypothetical protein